LNRFDEAEQANKDLRTTNPDAASAHFNNYFFALQRGDRTTMDSEVQWASGKPEEADMTSTLAATAMFFGQLKKAEDLTRRALDLFKTQDRKENAGQVMIVLGSNAALFGKCQQAREHVTNGLALSRGRISTPLAALVFATCNDLPRAQSLLDESLKLYPKDTIVASMVAPLIRAEMERNHGNAAEATQLLEAVRGYDLGIVAGVGNNYLRGSLYLLQRKGNEAAGEFQKIIDHRGVDGISPLHTLAHLGKARAAAISGDMATSRKEYQDFFAFWKDADQDLPILVEAKKEYQQLK